MDREDKIHIIVAEDDFMIREWAIVPHLEDNFREHNIVIHQAVDGKIAANIINDLKAEGIQPDILITDRNMPEMDGFQLLSTWVVQGDNNLAKFMYSGQERNENDKVFSEAQRQAEARGVQFAVKPNLNQLMEKVGEKLIELRAGLAHGVA